MYLLDKPLPYMEVRAIKALVDGNVARICISNDPEEIVKSLGFAIDRLSQVAYSRVKEIMSESNGSSTN